MITKEITRVKGNKFCTIELKINDGKFSLCGTAGYIVSNREAKREALEFWTTLFDMEDPAMMKDTLKNSGTKFRSPKSAAKYILQCDGEFSGLDVDYRNTTDKQVFISNCWGQIREEIAEYFPEAIPFFKWHLNDMKAECEHQEARGENWKNNPSAVCPECGWKLGHGWSKRELPKEVYDFVENLNS